MRNGVESSLKIDRIPHTVILITNGLKWVPGVTPDEKDGPPAPPIATIDAEMRKPCVAPLPTAATSIGFSPWNAAISDLISAILASINAA